MNAQQAPAGDQLIATETNTARSSLVIAASTFAATLLGGVFAVAVTLIVGAGADSDGFFAAYSAYTAFIVFGTSMRVALVPQLGTVEQPVQFKANAVDRVSRLLPVVLLVCSALFLLAPALGYVLTLDAPGTTRETAIQSTALLSVAAFFQIWAAVTAAVLAGARRFVATSVVSAASLAVSVVVGIGLLSAVGILGASFGMICGAVTFALAQVVYLRRFGFHAPPAFRKVFTRETWLVAGRMAVAAVLPVVLQLYLTVSLGAISGLEGAVTAYTYGYLLLTVIAAISTGTISMVSMPAAVDAVHQHGDEAAKPFIRDAGSMGLFLYLPLAASYALFGLPVVDLVFGGSLDAQALDVLWDTSRIFMLLGVVWALGIPFTTYALAQHLYSRVAAVAAAMFFVQVSALLLLSFNDPVDVAWTHVAGGAVLFSVLAVAILGRRAAGAALAEVLASVGAILLLGVFALIWWLAGEPGNVAESIAFSAIGCALYAALSYVTTPNLGRRLIDQVLNRHESSASGR